jgi:ABC-type antimicrobial peptide transport system permease subunit
MIGSAALTGALLVGDSVRESLRAMAVARLGNIHFTVNAQDRFFEANLPQRLCDAASPLQPAGTTATNPASPSPCPLSAILLLPGVAARPDASARANQVNTLGVEPETWAGLAQWGTPANTSSPEAGKDKPGLDRLPLSEWQSGQTAFLNETLARQLNVQKGDEIVLRVRKPSALGLDAAISPRNENTVAFRLKIGAVLTAEMLGDFRLSAQPVPPANLFLPRKFLAERLGVSNRANLLVAGPILPSVSTEEALSRLSRELDQAWLPGDAGLIVRTIQQPQSATGGTPIPPSIELASTRIFLEPQVVASALTPRTNLLSSHPQVTADTENDLANSRFVTNGTRVLTYLVNLIRAGERATPYSVVTASEMPFVPADLRDNEIIINQWLADDLKAGPGDSVELSYFVVDSGSHLVERTNSFVVREIVPITGLHADRTLMPEFPGLAKAESTHDWDAGFPLTYPIRDKDEAYWKQNRGTPKAFITLAAGQAMWANRFGTLTAVRYPVPANSPVTTCREAVYRNLLANLSPAEIGLRFEPTREQALCGAQQAQDFGQLFLGFSIFLVVAALLLMALLFQFGLEQRMTEVGTLLAVGLTPRQVRRLLLSEGALLALAGGVLGVLGGIAYARAMLWGLATIWRGAVGTSSLHFHMTLTTVIVGLCASVVVAFVTIWLIMRRQARQPARDLLAGELQYSASRTKNRSTWLGLACGLLAVGIVAWALVAGENQNAGAFFGAGALLLIGGLALASTWLGRFARTSVWSRLTLGRLGVRGCARRRKRSLATVALLASGCFVIMAIGVFRLDANRDAARRGSGTGGFALIGESALPIVKDLNTQAGRDLFGLGDQELAGVTVVPFRVRAGDEASCLNLSRAQKPRLLGVKPELLAGRFTFAGVEKGFDHRKGWELLKAPPVASRSPASAEEIPAIGDANAIEWALGKRLGDTIDYTDEFGRAFKLRLVGAVANSILQGSLIIDEAAFVRKFPGESGYRMLLLDAPPNSAARISTTLSRALQDVGLELVPTVQRLAAFNAVQNTYLGTFQILGGLGLLLGSAGLGIVVLRNVWERRGELGLLTAVGFRRTTLHQLVLSEHGALLALGLGLGIFAAVIAVLPAVLSPGTELPYGSLGLTLGAVLLNGGVWTWLAVRRALKGNLLAALRNE